MLQTIGSYSCHFAFRGAKLLLIIDLTKQIARKMHFLMIKCSFSWWFGKNESQNDKLYVFFQKMENVLVDTKLLCIFATKKTI